MAALGAETSSGDFEVIEYCFAGLPPQPALKPAKFAAVRLGRFERRLRWQPGKAVLDDFKVAGGSLGQKESL
jgi:hypothetical protein